MKKLRTGSNPPSVVRGIVYDNSLQKKLRKKDGRTGAKKWLI
jgi:hypothetical protein